MHRMDTEYTSVTSYKLLQSCSLLLSESEPEESCRVLRIYPYLLTLYDTELMRKPCARCLHVEACWHNSYSLSVVSTQSVCMYVQYNPGVSSLQSLIKCN